MVGFGGTIGLFNCFNDTDLIDELHDPLESRLGMRFRQVKREKRFELDESQTKVN